MHEVIAHAPAITHNRNMLTDRIHVPFFVIACVLMAIAALVELGSSSLIPTPVSDSSLLRAQAGSQLSGYSDEDREKLTTQLISDSRSAPKPPGMGIRDMAVLDGLLCFTLAIILAGEIIPGRFWGRTQGVVTLVVSILVLFASIGFIIARFIKVLIMVALLTATPFGTLAYLAIWGFFNRGGAATALSLLMVLKIASVIFLVLAYPRFLQNKGLMLIIVTSLVANIIVSFLHGLVPVFLVSITDGIAAIVVLILAAIWAVVFLIFSVVSIVKAIV